MPERYEYEDETIHMVCPLCKGEGYVYEHNIVSNCDICNGRGYVRKSLINLTKKDDKFNQYIGR